MNKKYEEIIDLPHPTSNKHPRMSKSDRAAQFAPYSALSGYEDAVEETANQNLLEYEKTANSYEDFATLPQEELP